jgi:hypothetical protein
MWLSKTCCAVVGNKSIYCLLSYILSYAKGAPVLKHDAMNTCGTVKVKLQALFICRSLFKHAVSNSNYIASNDCMIMGNEPKIMWNGVIAGYSTIPAFTQWEWRKSRNVCQESQPPGRNARRAPQGYKCTVLPLEPTSGLDKREWTAARSSRHSPEESPVLTVYEVGVLP